MNGPNRKALLQAYKERRKQIGVFAVRCQAAGCSWVGVSRNLDSQQNGLWFTLRLGSHPDRALQSCWKGNGEAEFTYEVLEVIEEEGLSAYQLGAALKERRTAWKDELGASALS